MSIQSEIARINSEVSEQESLINQIKTALEGKAAGGGSGGSVETCTVILERFGAIGTNRLLYTNGNMAVTEGTLTLSGKVNFSGTFEVAKGTLLYTFFIDTGGTANIEGEAEIISTNLYAINGDATISS